jgi:hypothetical protein
MTPALEVYLEAGTKRVFAGAVDWPGLCRSDRSEDAALQALIDYTPRYVAALGTASRGLPRPGSVSDLRVVERLKGDATTDFGAKRQVKLWRACGSALDAAAAGAVGKALTRGPRGGGRELDAIVAHVFEAERAYLRLIGGRVPGPDDGDAAAAMPGCAPRSPKR